MAKRKRTRKTYTAAQRRTILAAAQKHGLTAAQVQKKFGVTPVTYYSWRKKSGVSGSRGRRGRPASAPTGGLAGVVRSEVQQRVRGMLPGIVRSEVNAYLDSVLGGGRRRGRPRKS